MTPSIVRQLVLKDLYLTRWIVIGSTVAGLVALGIAPLSPTAFYVGGVSFICVLVVLNIFLVTVGVMQEKKDKVLLFVLSLPISTTQYTFAKMAANFTAFFVPWLLLTVASLVIIAATGLPNGLMPFTTAISLYLLCYYCLLLGVAIATESPGWITAVIVAGNISVNFFIPLVFRLPSAGPGVSTETAVWGRDIITVLVLEVVVCAAALVVTSVVQSRKKDFV
jgi:ABC-2 type transport system permease protein